MLPAQRNFITDKLFLLRLDGIFTQIKINLGILYIVYAILHKLVVMWEEMKRYLINVIIPS